MTDTELLREAAALMRQRAQAANTEKSRRPYSDPQIPVVPTGQWGDMVDDYLGGDVGQHCASWTPTVALAVADWLDIGANPYACVDRDPMLAVARAYLHTDSSPTDDESGETCAGCGDRIPPGTPPYAADLAGPGRLCRDCAQRCEGGTDNVVACHDCPGGPLFGRGEIPLHRRVAHTAPGNTDGEA